MYHFFSKKPILADLIPERFVDIHSHILPGIDDGAKDIEESISLISQMKKMGFSKIIGTPHTYQGLYDNTNESIKDSFDSLKKKLKKDIEIGYASEYMIDGSLLKRIEENSLLTLKEKYVLVEMSFISAPIDLYEIIFKLQLKGYIPVLAHPERYIFYFNDFKNYFKLKSVGCKFQINLLSTTGYYGRNIVKITNMLLKNNLVDFVGSDIHSQKHIDNFMKKIKIVEIEKLKKVIENTMIFI
tara:strand:+ start:1536 stop:2261 length:726 start_codon:yes stop_codon:yes gene_type:complete